MFQRVIFALAAALSLPLLLAAPSGAPAAPTPTILMPTATAPAAPPTPAPLAATIAARPDGGPPPALSLPLPPGETWRVIQGYGCGTHDGPEDFYALDLARARGPSLGAPVRAAADGVVMAWVEASGSLILSHGGGYLTMYTHMEPLITARGSFVARGEQLGYVGERGAPGNPHLHFVLLSQPGGFTEEARRERRALPLRFSDGPDLPDIGGCGQHQGALIRAPGSPPAAEPIYCPPVRDLCKL